MTDILKILKQVRKSIEIEEEKIDKLDKQTVHNLPSNRIKFLAYSSLDCEPKSIWIKSILRYLDEEYKNKQDI